MFKILRRLADKELRRRLDDTEQALRVARAEADLYKRENQLLAAVVEREFARVAAETAGFHREASRRNEG